MNIRIYLPSSAVAFLAGLLLCAIPRASAQTFTESKSFTLSLDIPDNDLAGAADTRSISSFVHFITTVKVSLTIAGTPNSADAFNGDFYAYLTHGSGFAVLLNRVGRTSANDFGYADSGFDVTFDDSGSALDIHNYAMTTDPGGAALTGLWGSDGRNVHPSLSLETTPRSAFLTSFNGEDANGDWTLFIADVSATGTGRLASWRLELTGVVPEPGSGAFLIFGGLALLSSWRRGRTV